MKRRRRVLPAVVAALCANLSGCAEVSDPMSPEETRVQVTAAARDMEGILHGDLQEANFSYESCNDQGDPPFRGVVRMGIWMPGVPHDQAADPKLVLNALAAHGWGTDSDLISHSPTVRKGAINAIVTISPPPRADKPLGAHVSFVIDGECRDTFDHRSDRSILPVDVADEVRTS